MVSQLTNADFVAFPYLPAQKIPHFHELCQMDEKLVPKQMFLSSSKCSTSILDVLRIFLRVFIRLCVFCVHFKYKYVVVSF